ncbi:MAG: glycosyltransferase family 4 protein [Phycisphaerae bacterium]|nr:glycosyltransferase family 4 protein [Phycisphaerae bacterium]
MKVLMLGWEFPPFISGGLGTACYGLTRALNDLGTEVSFVLPRPVEECYTPQASGESGTSGDTGPVRSYRRSEFQHVRFWALGAALAPYLRPEVRKELQTSLGKDQPLDDTVHLGAPYAGDLFAEVERYARLAIEMAFREPFNVIHAHDWMTFPAGVAVAMTTGKPLVVHVHSTEFDRCGESVNERICRIERRGLRAADAVIAVSQLTKGILVKSYGIDPANIHVVYNSTHSVGPTPDLEIVPIADDEKIVLFLGRITAQKGPEYFLQAAQRVLEHEPKVRFIVAGSGDMIRHIIEQAAELGIGDKVVFTGFLQGDDVERVFRMADLYVMPSVSEPFGIAALEALSYDVPVLISKQSGAAEVLKHVIKVDFWDTAKMADRILAVLRNPPLQAALRAHGRLDLRRLSWESAARQCLGIYAQVAGMNSAAGRVPPADDGL